METVFATVLNMSATGSIVIVAVLAARLMLRRVPKKWSYLLWSVAGFRLACPVSFGAAFSAFTLLRERTFFQDETGQMSTLELLPLPVGGGSASAPGPGWTAAAGGAASPASTTTAAHMPDLVTIAAWVWLAVALALLLYGVASYWHTRRTLDTAFQAEGSIWQSEAVRSPFILGIFRPRIYIPFGLEGEELRYVLAHEQYHLRHGDHLVRIFAFILLTVHWFNPLCALAYALCGRDMEMRCDEAVLDSGESIRKAYSRTLLSFAEGRRFPRPSPLAFGEASVRSRIQNALRWKRPRTWVTALAAVLCVAVIAACGANPADSPASAAEPGGTGQLKNMEGIYEFVEDYVRGRGQELLLQYTLETEDSKLGNTKIVLCEKGRAVSNLDPKGALEYWKYRMSFSSSSPDAESLTADGFMQDTEGYWFERINENTEPPEREVIALHYPDGSYDILYDKLAYGMGLADGYDNISTAIYDWYVKENNQNLPQNGEPLTLADVLQLAGDNRLDWASMEQWPHSDIGSGLCVWKFEMEDHFYFLVGGPNISENPWYSRLYFGDGEKEYLDFMDLHTLSKNGYTENDIKTYIESVQTDVNTLDTIANPPDLFILGTQEAARTIKNGYEWYIDNGETIKVNRISPEEILNLLEKQYILAIPSNISPTVYLSFQAKTQPDSISITCYSPDDPNRNAINIPSYYSEEGFHFDLTGGSNIYNILAVWDHWDEPEHYRGSVNYCFFGILGITNTDGEHD